MDDKTAKVNSTADLWQMSVIYIHVYNGSAES